MFACDADMRIVLWNEAAERLTGIPAEDALDEPCWRVLAGREDDGSLACHRGCSRVRLARNGWPVKSHTLNVRTPKGMRRLDIDVVSVRDPSSFRMIHLLRCAPAREAGGEEVETGVPIHLTPRQREILRLLDFGLGAHAIAQRLELAENTVRNHIRAVLAELGAHSQLQAVHEARRRGLLAGE